MTGTLRTRITRLEQRRAVRRVTLADLLRSLDGEPLDPDAGGPLVELLAAMDQEANRDG